MKLLYCIFLNMTFSVLVYSAPTVNVCREKPPVPGVPLGERQMCFIVGSGESVGIIAYWIRLLLNRKVS